MSSPLKTMYYALIHSHLNYCSLITGCTSETNIKRVLTLQKKAIRTILNKKHNASTLPLFQALNILPFDKILTLNKNLFMHDFTYNCNPTFKNYWITNAERNLDIELRNNLNYFIPTPKYEGFKRFPLYNFAKSWNELNEMKFQNNRSIFKNWLKNHLLIPPP